MKHGISLLLIEDNRLLRNGIAAMIAKQPDLRLTAALPRLDVARLRSSDIRPDIVLLDAALPNHDSPGAVRTVKLLAPHAKVIVMGIVEFVKAGASGFILKDATFAEFARTIRAVFRERTCCSLPPHQSPARDARRQAGCAPDRAEQHVTLRKLR